MQVLEYEERSETISCLLGSLIRGEGVAQPGARTILSSLLGTECWEKPMQAPGSGVVIAKTIMVGTTSFVLDCHCVMAMYSAQ